MRTRLTDRKLVAPHSGIACISVYSVPLSKDICVQNLCYLHYLYLQRKKFSPNKPNGDDLVYKLLIQYLFNPCASMLLMRTVVHDLNLKTELRTIVLIVAVPIRFCASTNI